MAEHEKPHEIIIVRRKRGGHDAHHGGGWKIAFADFMTAMMAFFLVLWIVNSTSKETRSSVARYFNPIRLAETTPARKGLQDPKENEFEENGAKPKTAKEKPEEAQNGAEKAASSQPEKPQSEVKKADEKKAEDKKAEEKKAESKDAKKAEEKDAKKPAPAASSAQPGPVRPGYYSPTRSESELFDDPMAALADIGKLERTGQAGLDAPKIFRDPFEAVAPVIAPKPATVPAARADAQVGAGTNPRNQDGAPAEKPSELEKAGTPDQVIAQKIAMALQKSNGPEASARKAEQETNSAANAAVETSAASPSSVDALQARITAALKEDVNSKGEPRIEMRKTEEGLLISLTDSLDFGMFAIGSAEPQPRTIKILEKVGRLLKDENAPLVVVGHTDSRPFKAGTSDNWRLSMSRAQMAFYMLLRGGVPEKRFERIEGRGDHSPRNTQQPDASENRRIEILVRKAGGAR